MVSRAFLDKLRTIATPRRLGATERRVSSGAGPATTIETIHWDGRQDAVVRPDVIRFRGRVHQTGRQAGQVAEIRPLSTREQWRREHGT